MNEHPISLPALTLPPLPEERTVKEALRHAKENSPAQKIVVLDDDPTGVQTVHGVPVYTDWGRETFRRAFLEEGPLFFVLTNSRSLTAADTVRAHTEIAENLAAACRETGREFLLVSRSDSTLRGHYPLETATLRRELEARLPLRFDGEVLMPYFAEGGRYTIGNVHYVRSGETLLPAGQTEFARDSAFAYRASDLTEWIDERTEGEFPAGEVSCVSLEELRTPDVEGITQKLLSVHDFGKIVVNAADDRDAEVFAAALFRAVARGGTYLFRSAAGLVRVLGGIEKRPLLTGAELCVNGGAGLILVGSHVQKTTAQLHRLLDDEPGLLAIEFDVSAAMHDGALRRERDRVLTETERALASGQTAVVYTSRAVLRSGSGAPEDDLRLSVEISHALSSLVEKLTTPPSFLIAKGGITSSDVGTRGLAVRRAMVLGQILPGVPVWETGAESRFPGLPYVIFPGNVGDEDALLLAVRKLRGET